MSIVIKQRGENYRMEIREEEFEFSSQEELMKQVKSFLDFKNKFGRLKNE